MTCLKRNSDYKDKYRNSLQESKTKLKGNIVIWKTNNRLSYMRFWKNVNITNIKAKTRINK